MKKSILLRTGIIAAAVILCGAAQFVLQNGSETAVAPDASSRQASSAYAQVSSTTSSFDNFTISNAWRSAFDEDPRSNLAEVRNPCDIAAQEAGTFSDAEPSSAYKISFRNEKISIAFPWNRSWGSKHYKATLFVPNSEDSGWFGPVRTHDRGPCEGIGYLPKWYMYVTDIPLDALHTNTDMKHWEPAKIGKWDGIYFETFSDDSSGSSLAINHHGRSLVFIGRDPKDLDVFKAMVDSIQEE